MSEITTEKGSLGEEVTKHESFGMISYSRQQTNSKKLLFGSSIQTGTVIGFSIHEAELHRDLHKDWFFQSKPIIDILLTPNQFAEFLTNGNTTGVPCTITYRQDKKENHGMIEGVTVENKRVLFEKEFKESLSEVSGRVRTFVKGVSDILNKQTVSKKDREELISMAKMVAQQIDSNLPFVQKSFNEAMDKTVTEAKAEFEAAIDHKVYTLGLEALKDQITTKLLTAGGESAPVE
jgi:hypothetical protein